jgi:hypothetical protein
MVEKIIEHKHTKVTKGRKGDIKRLGIEPRPPKDKARMKMIKMINLIIFFAHFLRRQAGRVKSTQLGMWSTEEFRVYTARLTWSCLIFW